MYKVLNFYLQNGNFLNWSRYLEAAGMLVVQLVTKEVLELVDLWVLEELLQQVDL